jgi:serine/threonine protein kinase
VSQSKPVIPEPSEIAGRYQIVKKLGAGAFGTVYKAKDRILGRMVAIKTIRLEGLAAAGASLEELMDRFKREAQVSAQLKHPNIVTIYDIGDSDGMSYLAMEFIDGVGLDRIIASEGRVNLERAASIGAQVADALDFAHRNSVVHRDIKPANIMIEGGDRVKVTDFGIAKVTNSGEHLTMTGSLLGTPSYMSPEQAKGSELDGRSDLFAVGCVLYEMLAGKKAFRGDSITGLIFKIITEEPEPLRQLDPSLPEEALRIISRALSKAPDARYQSGQELARDLLALTRAGSTPTLRQSESPTAKSTPAATMLLPNTPAPGAPATLATPPTSLGAPPTQVSAPPPPRPTARPAAVASPPPPRPAPAAAAAKSSSKAPLLIGLAVAAFLGVVVLGAAGWFVYQRMNPGRSTADAGATHTVRTSDTATETSLPPATTEPTQLETRASERPPDRVETPPPAVETTVETGRTATRNVPSREPNRTERADSRRVADRSGVAEESERPPVGRTKTPVDRGNDTGTRTAAGGDFGFLDQEPPMDGGEVGEHLADTYRSQQGRTSTGTFGSRRVFRARERSPRNLLPIEMPAVATLRHLITFEEAFQKKEGRYGSIAEMMQSHGLRLDVAPQANTFQRRGYRFELKVTGDGFQVTAIPVSPGPRPFMGDDSGIIRPGLE